MCTLGLLLFSGGDSGFGFGEKTLAFLHFAFQADLLVSLRGEGRGKLTYLSLVRLGLRFELRF